MSLAALELVRRALAGADAWLVGGAVRDHALGRELVDVDVVVDGDPEQAAQAIASAARVLGERVACFALSHEFGAWRVAAPAGAWQVDVERMRGGSLAADLALRDFTVNAVAERLDGGERIDPLGGLQDLRAGRLRLAGPRAFEDDPLRVLRLVRVAIELRLQPEPETLAAAHAQAPRLEQVSPERVLLELQRVMACADALRGLELMREVGAEQVVLPEVEAMRGVEQSRFHHRDVYGHTLEVLEHAIALTAGDPGEIVGERHAGAVAALLAEPLADGMTRGEALRWGALLHDAAKPATRVVRAIDRRVTFLGHDALGAQLAGDLLARLRASVRLREHVAALVRHHLRLGFLVHERQPLEREAVFDYLSACSPVEVDVTLLSVCDRLSTRGKSSEQSIARHMELADAMLADALLWREQGPPAALLRGDELADALGIARGPGLGELLAALARAQFAGRVSTREQALAFAREVQSAPTRS